MIWLNLSSNLASQTQGHLTLQHLYHTLACDDLYNLAVLKHLEDMPLGVSMCGGWDGTGIFGKV